MKIFPRAQIYEADQVTVERQKITMTELMERAGTEIFKWMHLKFRGTKVPIHVFCGIGNNGGDGLVVARHLIAQGYNVFVYVVNYSDKRSNDFLVNYERLKQVTNDSPKVLGSKEEFPEINAKDIIVDAIFGIGLNRPAADWVKHLFEHFRASKAYTLSIDIPSGLYLEKVPEDEDGVVWANCTLTFQFPKLVFFLPETAKYTKQLEILDIGIDQDYIRNTTSNTDLVERQEALELYRPRDKFAHKGNLGHALIVGGSYGKIGAVVLACRAAMSSGAGLVTAYIPKCGYQVVQSAFPEAMVITDESENIITEIKYYIKASAIGIGMGLGTDPQTVEALETFLKSNTKPLVVDADAINILSKHKDLLKLLPEQSVLTPHPGELKRLIGNWKDDFEKLGMVKDFTEKYNVIVVIKGAHTITVYKDQCHINSTGNPGLATAGSGDVLTGIIASLIAQGYKPLQATIFGVYLHGKSADIAVKGFGRESLIASHVIQNLGKAYLDVVKPSEQIATDELP